METQRGKHIVGLRFIQQNLWQIFGEGLR